MTQESAQATVQSILGLAEWIEERACRQVWEVQDIALRVGMRDISQPGDRFVSYEATERMHLTVSFTDGTHAHGTFRRDREQGGILPW